MLHFAGKFGIFQFIDSVESSYRRIGTASSGPRSPAGMLLGGGRRLVTDRRTGAMRVIRLGPYHGRESARGVEAVTSIG